MTGTINQLLWTLAPKALKFFLSIKSGRSFPPTKYMANDDFSEPPRRTDSKNPIFIFCRILGLGHLRGLGLVSGEFLGSRRLSPFCGKGGIARGLYRPPPPLFN